MTLHLVLRHKDDSQTWSNAWLDFDRIDTIQTNREVADRCRNAMNNGNTVNIHRCAWAGGVPMLSCSANVTSVDQIDKSSWLVKFGNQIATGLPPSVQPMHGQNLYDA